MRARLCVRAVDMCTRAPDSRWQTDVGDDFPFQSDQICVTVPIWRRRGPPSSPAANAVLVIRRGAPQVMEADPGLEHESINTDCDEQAISLQNPIPKGGGGVL